jgi:O-antigen/teichoic acid export membrane protein
LVAAPAAVRAPGLAHRTVTGAAWATLAFVAARALSYGSNLVLARLLAPADFGLVSFAMIFIGASALLQDLGVAAAIVHSGRDPRAVAGTALTINVVAALALFGVVVLATPLVASMQADPATPMVLIALAVTVVITAFGSVQNALLTKQLAYRRKFWPDSVPYAVGGAVSVVMALYGFGVWSLVVGNLLRVSTSCSGCWSRSAPGRS